MTAVPADYWVRVDAYASTEAWREEASQLLWAAPRTVFHLFDVGCGTGAMVPVAEHHGVRRYTGVDPLAANLDVARSRHPTASFVQGGWDVLRHQRDLDTVVMNHVLPHVDDPLSALIASWFALRRGGQIGIALANPWHDRLWRPANLFNGYRGDPTIRRLFEVSEIRRMLTNVGFDVVSVQTVGERHPHFGFLGDWTRKSILVWAEK